MGHCVIGQSFFDWLKHSNEIIAASSKSANKSRNLRRANYPKLEDSLITFIKCAVEVFKGFSIVCEDVFRRKAFEIKDALVLELWIRNLRANEELRNTMGQGLKFLLEFKATTNWLCNFKQSTCLKSMKLGRE